MRLLFLIMAVLLSENIIAQDKADSLILLNRNLFLASEAWTLYENDDVHGAIRLLVSSLSHDTDKHHIPVNQNSMDLLEKIHYSLAGNSIVVGNRRLSCVTFSPDNKYVAAIEDTDLVVFDVATGQQVGEEMKNYDKLNRCIFSPDGEHILVHGYNDITIWHFRTSKITTMLKMHSALGLVQYSPDGKGVYVLSGNSFIDYISVDGINYRKLAFNTGNIKNFSISTDKSRILVTYYDNEMKGRVFDIDRCIPVGEEFNNFTSAQISPSGDDVLVCNMNGDNYVIDAVTTDLKFKLGKNGELKYTLSGNYIYGKLDNFCNRLHVYNGSDGEHLYSKFMRVPICYFYTLSSDAEYIANLSYDDLHISTVLERNTRMSHSGNILCADVSKDNSLIATCANDSTARIFHLVDGKPAVRPLLHPHKNVREVKFSPDGTILATRCDNDNVVRLWDVKSGTLLSADISSSAYIYSMDFSPCGNYLIVSSFGDRPIARWNVTGKGEPLIFSGHEGAVNKVRYSSCGNFIYSVSNDGKAIRWDASSGTASGKPMLHNAPVRDFVVNENLNFLATVGKNGEISLWNLQTCEKLHDGMMHDRYIKELAFSEDGSMMASTSIDSTLRIWSTVTGDLLTPPIKFNAQTQTPLFIKDDFVLAVSCWDKTMYLYDTRNWNQLRNTIKFQKRPHELFYTPDKKYLVLLSLFHPVKVWENLSVNEIVSNYMNDTRFNTGFTREDTLKYNLAIVDSLGNEQAANYYLSAHYASEASRYLSKGLTDKAKELVNLALPSDYPHTKQAFCKEAESLMYNIHFKYDAAKFEVDGAVAANFSRCGNYIIVSKQDSTTVVYNASDFTPKYTLTHGRAVNGHSLSPDGKHLAVNGDGFIKVYNLKDGTLAYNPIILENVVLDSKLSDSGKILVYSHKEYVPALELWDLNTGTNHVYRKKHLNYYWSISNSGKYVLYSQPVSYTYLHDVQDGNRLLYEAGFKGNPFNASDIDPDGKHFAYTNGHCAVNSDGYLANILEVRNIKGNNPLVQSFVFEQNIVNLKYSPDGKYLCVLTKQDSNKGYRQQIALFRRGEPEPVFMLYLPKPRFNSYMDIKFSPDSQYIIFNTFVEGLYIVKSDGTNPYPFVNYGCSFIELSPDNKYFLTISGTKARIIERP